DPFLQTTKAISSSLYMNDLEVNAGNVGLVLCIRISTTIHGANQVAWVDAKTSIIKGCYFFVR
ncbi:hypothetical protein G6N85_20615, partial [Salmonella enterica subsp. enterica serovar Typhi]